MDFADKGAWKHYRRFGMQFGFDIDDYKAAAYMGLVHAAMKFEPERGWTFKTYAFKWCEQYLGRVGRIERRQKGWMYNATKKERDAGAPKNQMVRVASVGAWPTNEEGEEIELPGPARTDDEDIARKEFWRLIVASATNERERTILVGQLQGKNFRQIGKDCGLSYERVRQLLPGILDQARRYLEERGINGASFA